MLVPKHSCITLAVCAETLSSLRTQSVMRVIFVNHDKTLIAKISQKSAEIYQVLLSRHTGDIFAPLDYRNITVAGCLVDDEPLRCCFQSPHYGRSASWRLSWLWSLSCRNKINPISMRVQIIQEAGAFSKSFEIIRLFTRGFLEHLGYFFYRFCIP